MLCVCCCRDGGQLTDDYTVTTRGRHASFRVTSEPDYKITCLRGYPSSSAICSHSFRDWISTEFAQEEHVRGYLRQIVFTMTTTNAVNVFGQKLLSEWRQHHVGENLIFSPLSISACFLLAHNGARGKTKTELETLFNFDVRTLFLPYECLVNTCV